MSVDPMERRRVLTPIVRRHAESEGFCVSCSQPWPCDIKRVGWIMEIRAEEE